MNQNIITYLNKNKEKYSKDVLVAELHKAGYSEGDIAEGVAQVFDGAIPAPILVVQTSFWNFKDKKAYTKASEKWADFLFGVFAPMGLSFVLGVVLMAVRYFFGVVMFALWVLAIVYLFNRRRFIFYGMMSSMVILPALFILFMVVMFRF